MRTNVFSYLRETTYPGRGILLGKSPDGKYGVVAYFIMGRSENSRNRVFETTPDGIRTKAFDEAKMTDPTLILYNPVRVLADGTVVVSNGDQTDTLAQALEDGKTMQQALAARTVEPDGPNWTPRISGLLLPGGDYALSIIKTAEGDPKSVCRSYFEYEHPEPGSGHFISTYDTDGSPLPSFTGEPVLTDIRQHDPRELARVLWEAMDHENRVALFVAWVDLEIQIIDEVTINAREQEQE